MMDAIILYIISYKGIIHNYFICFLANLYYLFILNNRFAKTKNSSILNLNIEHSTLKF